MGLGFFSGVPPLCFNSSLEWTNQWLALERAFNVFMFLTVTVGESEARGILLQYAASRLDAAKPHTLDF